MKREDALQLIDALLARPNAIEDARRAFTKRFPDAPKEMIDTATFHVCVDGIDAALVWLASIEQFLRQPNNGLCSGATWHLFITFTIGNNLRHSCHSGNPVSQSIWATSRHSLTSLTQRPQNKR